MAARAASRRSGTSGPHRVETLREPSAAGTPLLSSCRTIGGRAVTFHDIEYAVADGLGVITLARPAYRNAQSYRMLDEIDAAFDRAKADRDVRVLIIRGSDGNFSTGHDLGTAEGMEYRDGLGAEPGIEVYDQFKKYNLDLLVK